LSELARVITTLKAPLGDDDPKAAVDDLMRRLPLATRHASAMAPSVPWLRRGLVAGGLAAVLAAAAVAIVPRVARGPGDAFQARGAPLGSAIARGVGVRVLRGGGREELASGARVLPSEAYTVAYRNLLEQPAHLLVFAVDATTAVHWVCPTYLDPTTNPASFTLPASTPDAALPFAVQLESPAPGTMRFVAIVTHSPLHVRDVEALHGADLEYGALRARWPDADVRELASVQVEPHP
jgi:hypothetical protein